MASNIPITNGQGQSSVAAEEISSLKYQQIKVVGGETGSTSVMGVNPDRSINVSVLGTVQVTGSVVAVGNPSVSGTVGASILGVVPVFWTGQGFTPTVRLSGSSNTSVITVSNDSSVLSVPVGSVITVWQNSSVLAVPIGSTISVWQDSSVIARVTGSVVTVPSGSVITTNIGSVITVWQNSSVLAVPVGSTVAVLQAPSIVGSYAEDAAHATGDKGLFALGVRHDTLTSVTSASGDYSPFTFGPSGETITANAPLTKWIRGTADMRGVGALGGSVVVLAAQGASVFTYVTSAQIVNIGGASVLVTLAGGLGSTLGYTIAPAGGGSNIIYPNALKTGENSAVTASISGVASILVSLQGFIANI